MKKSLLSLAFGTFALGMAQYVIMGILPDVAKSLGVTIPVAGRLVSAYAVGIVVGAPLAVVFARRTPLKKLLIALSAFIFAGNLLSALAPTFPVMVVAVFIAGLPHGAYFSNSAIAAGKLAEPGKEASAVAATIMGITLANLVGVPLGTFLARVATWRLSFVLITLCAVLLALSLWRWLPILPAASDADTGLKGQFRFLKKPGPWLIIVSFICANAAVFCWYSYVNPVMTESAGFPVSSMTFIMLLAGFGMVLGNIVSGKLSDRFSTARVTTWVQAWLLVMLLGVFLFTTVKPLALVFLFAGAFGMFSLSAPEQQLLIENSKGCEMLGAASAQMAFNAGGALGPIVGSIPLKAGLGYNWTALPGAGFALLAVLCMIAFRATAKKTNA